MTMRWSDLSAAGWDVPSEDRQKGTGGLLPLPHMTRAIIEARPRLASNAYVFAGRKAGPFNGMSKAKERFNTAAKLPERWTVHDLRRTARSLMSRAGVRPDIAERVMGHTIRGVEGVYDRHHYAEEKGDALTRLARLLETILTPPTRKVVPLRGAR